MVAGLFGESARPQGEASLPEQLVPSVAIRQAICIKMSVSDKGSD